MDGMKRILLVAPLPLRFELTQDDLYLKLPFSKVKSFILPLHIATVAGLTPDEFDVELWDESVRGRIDDWSRLQDYDLVGITGYTAHLPRARAIAQVFRKWGIPVAIGGPGISSMLYRYRDDFDIFIIGAAELIWPRFLRDWKKGVHQRVYQQVGAVDLSLTPMPRWESISDQMQHYYLGAVQTSRGCPFECEFCDVRYLFGRRFQHKPVDNVLKEISLLEKLGMRRIVFCDDNFYGNPRYTRDLLREIIALNKTFCNPMAFAGEMSINIAADEELLRQLADANFIEVFIGIESPNKESLKETNKLQNFRSNLIGDIQKIQSFGMSVRGSLIVGFDHDDKDIFNQQFRFVQEACLTVPSIRVLMAPPGTELWKRLCKEGRLLTTETEGRYFGNPGTTNIIPKKMTRLELHSGYLDLISKVYDWNNFAIRIKGFISNVRRRPDIPKQKGQVKRIVQFLYALFSSLDNKTRKVIIDICLYTWKHAPFMLPRVVAIMLRQYGYANRPKLKEAVQEQIEIEKSGRSNLEVQKIDSVVPESFKEPYEHIFPEIYTQVFSDIADKTLVNETVIEIFAGFLTGWMQTSDSFAEEHIKSLRELAGRIISEKNQTFKIQSLPPSPANDILPNLKETCLADDFFKAVEQEMLISEACVDKEKR
jgi:radical SAM superfamily enzyme YgiQ (UPF0313 family)